MTLPASVPPGSPDAPIDVRRRALRRLVIALLLLGAAFLALLGYGRLAPPRTVTSVAAPGTPAAPAPAPAPSTPAEERSTTGDAATVPAAEPAPETPARSAPPPPPVVINPEPPAPPAPGKPVARTTVGPPTPAVSASPPSSPSPAAPASTAASVPSSAAPVQPPAAAPPGTRVTDMAGVPARQPARSDAAKADPTRGYLVQAGVFGTPQNAEALQRKLAAAGLPATTETRVVLGPFRDRAEAERARETLRGLGVDALLMPGR